MALDHKDGPDQSTIIVACVTGTQATAVLAVLNSRMGWREGGRKNTAVCEKNGWSSSASAEISSRLGNDLSFVCSTCGTAM